MHQIKYNWIRKKRAPLFDWVGQPVYENKVLYTRPRPASVTHCVILPWRMKRSSNPFIGCLKNTSASWHMVWYYSEGWRGVQIPSFVCLKNTSASWHCVMLLWRMKRSSNPFIWLLQKHSHKVRVTSLTWLNYILKLKQSHLKTRQSFTLWLW